MSYRLTPNAVRGLRQILSRIEDSSPRIADKWRIKLLRVFEHIASWPHTGHLYHGLEDLPIRARSLGPYVVLFHPETRPVEIIAVEHGAQNLPATLAQRIDE